jgi:DNA-binding NarL/FixJ family response regulator
MQNGANGAPRRLSARQIQVIEALGRGLTQAEAAVELKIAEQTVKNHLFAARKTLELPNTVALIAWYYNRPTEEVSLVSLAQRVEALEALHPATHVHD